MRTLSFKLFFSSLLLVLLFVNCSKEISLSEPATLGSSPLKLASLVAFPSIPTNGLVAYYPFNGNANDVSGKGNNGKVYGAILTTDRFGNSNKAYSFNGTSSYISVPASTSLNTQNVTATSICGWFSCPSTGTPGGFIVRHGTTGTGGGIGEEVWFNSLNDLKMTMQNWWANQTPFFGVKSNVMSLNQWHFFTTVYDYANNKEYFYIDGALFGTYSSVLHKSTNPILNIGRNTNVTSYFNGKIDDIRIYNRVLTSSEILAIYNESLPTSGMVAYYPFNGNANDLSGNANNGTVYGASLTTDRFGNSNQAYSFNGINNTIDVPNSGTLDFSSDQFSFSFWMRISAYPVNGTGSEFINKYSGIGATDKGFMLVLDSNGNQFIYRYADASTTGGWGIESLSYSYFPSLGTWLHIVVTTNSGYDKLYLNGNLVSSNTTKHNFNIGANTAILRFGGNTPQNPGPYFNGSLDDIRIYNRPLTTAEVTALYIY